MKKIVSLAAGLLLMSASAAQAQTCTIAGGPFPANCTVAHTVSATAPAILKLTLSQTTTTLTAPGEADFDAAAGVNDLSSFTVNVKSNKTASATIHTAAANWTGPAGTTKAIGDLRWSISGGAPFTALTGTGATVVASAKGDRGETISWNTLWHLATDEPGVYSLPVTFTLVVP